MNIWIINAQENPPLEKSIINRKLWRSNCLAEYLADKSHKVYRIRSDFSHQSKKNFYGKTTIVPTDNYFHVYLEASWYKHHFGIRRSISHLILAFSFVRFAFHQTKPDLVHICNVPLELSLVATIFCNLNSIPFVLDVRDLWPQSYLNAINKHRNTFLSFSAKLILSPYFYFLSYCYRHSKVITSISAPMLDWALLQAHRDRSDKDSFFPFFNSPPCDQYSHSVSKFSTKYNLPTNTYIAVYSGNIGYQTDFDSILTFAKGCNSHAINIFFVIAGNGPRFDELSQRSSSMPNVLLTGWLDGSELSSLLSMSTFGLLAFFPSLDYKLSYPNKFVEYLAYSLIPISHTKGLMESLMKKHSLGIQIEDFSSPSSPSLLKQFFDVHPDIITQRRKSAEAFNQLFNINSVLPRMANHLLSLSDTIES